LRRLEPVAHVRQRARDDDRHRVIDVAGLHLGFDRDVHDLRAVVQCHGLRPIGLMIPRRGNTIPRRPGRYATPRPRSDNAGPRRA
jgi:hypothetical protein